MKPQSQKILKIWFISIQFLTVPFNFALTRLLKLKAKRPPHLRIPHGTLIIANHQSKIDPFLISYHIGVRNWTKIVPIRYPVTPDYMSRPILGFCIRLLGGYNIGETVMARAQKLLFTRQLLRSGYTIVIFPEGKIVHDSDFVEQFKRGAHMLFSEPCSVVFVRLTGLNEKHKFHFWRKDTRVTLTYSDCINASVPIEEKVAHLAKFYGIETSL